MRRNYFWGILLILIGLTYVARQVLNIYFPIDTLIISFVLIYWGISLITGHAGRHHHRDDRYREREVNRDRDINRDRNRDGYEQNILFSNNDIKANNEQDKYNILFSSSTIDLRDLPLPLENRNIKIDIIFSKGLIRINPDIPAIIKVDSAFSSARFPNNTQISFGDYCYTTRSYKEGMPHLYIKVDVVFGSSDIIE